MDKEHLIDLISNSIISEIKDLEINEEKLIANNYLNNQLNLLVIQKTKCKQRVNDGSHNRSLP